MTEGDRESSLSDFWHSSDDHRPAGYTARSVLLYSCGGCGRGLEGGPKAAWPRYCSLGHKNERPEY